MTPSTSTGSYPGKRLKIGAVVGALLATLAFAPGALLAAEKTAHEDRAEMRAKDMHAKLKITAAQEAQWAPVAAAIQDNGKIMDTLTKARGAHEKDMNAVDDLNSYGEIAEAHAAGIKNLLPKFTTLYASMSDSQKKAADTLFRDGEHRRHHKDKMSVVPTAK